VLAVAAIVVVVALYVIETESTSSSASTRPGSVKVSGSAVVAEPAAVALNLIFTDEGGAVFNATIANGHYSIILPTNHTYSVRFRWMDSPSLIPGYMGECTEANLTIPLSLASASLNKDWSC
jgi:hypothetical protein